MQKFVYVLFCVLTLTASYTSHAGEQDIEKTLLEKFVPSLEKDLSTVKGAAYAIVYKGNIISKKTFGYANDKTKVDENTLFLLSSASKPIMASVMAMLVSEGKLSFNTDVSKILNLKEPNITLEHLLSHSSGYMYTASNDLERGKNREAILRKFCPTKANFKPGTKYRYNNLLFSFTQDVTEKITNKDWKTSVSSFWNKIGVNSTQFEICEVSKDTNFATPHIKDDDSGIVLPRQRSFEEYPKNVCPSAGFFASLNAMTEFLKLQMGYIKNSGINNKYLSALQERKIFTPDVYSFGKKTELHWPFRKSEIDASYGLGWRILSLKNDKSNKTKIVLHGGFVKGANTLIAFIPHYNAGIVILTNQTGCGGYITFDSALEFWGNIVNAKSS